MRAIIGLVGMLAAGCAPAGDAGGALTDAGYVTCGACGCEYPCDVSPQEGQPCDVSTFYDLGSRCEQFVCAGAVSWECVDGVVQFGSAHGPCGPDAWTASVDAGPSDASADAPAPDATVDAR